MASFLPLIFQKNKRTLEEQTKFNILERARFGEYLEDLGHINGGKGWITFPETRENTSYYHMMPFYHKNIIGDLLGYGQETHITKSDLIECNKNYKELSSCIHYTALADGLDPLTVSSLRNLEESSSERCFPSLDRCVHFCGRGRLIRYNETREYELFFARLRRWVLTKTGDLREDLGVQRYPNTLFTFKELLKISEHSNNVKSIYEKITQLDFSYDVNLQVSKMKKEEFLKDGKNYLAAVFPLEGRAEKEKLYDLRLPVEKQAANMKLFHFDDSSRRDLGMVKDISRTEEGMIDYEKSVEADVVESFKIDRRTREKTAGTADKLAEKTSNPMWRDPKYWEDGWKKWMPEAPKGLPKGLR